MGAGHGSTMWVWVGVLPCGRGMGVRREDHIKDLQETFANLREANLKLNPKKCTFGGQKGKILGYIVSTKGIDPNPNKVQAILNMKVPKKYKGCPEVDRKTCCLK